MADFTQADHTLAALAMIVHPDSVAHTPATVATQLEGRAYILMANMEATANVAGVTFRVQGRTTAVTNGWSDIRAVSTLLAARGAAIGVNAAEPQGETEIAMDGVPTGDFTTGMDLYIHNTNGGSPASATGTLVGDEADSEFGIVDTSTTSPDVVVLIDGIAAAAGIAADDELIPDAELFSFDVASLAGYEEVRLLVEHRGATGSNIHYQAWLRVASDIE